MFTFDFLIKLLAEHGSLEVLAHDKSGVRPAEVIPRQPTVEETIDKIQNLKDGATTWTYSVKVEPSR